MARGFFNDLAKGLNTLVQQGEAAIREATKGNPEPSEITREEQIADLEAREQALFAELGEYALANDAERYPEFAQRQSEIRAEIERLAEEERQANAVPAEPVCPQCGEPCKEGAQFCSSCGTRLAKQEDACSACGAKCEPGSKFCPECGNPL